MSDTASATPYDAAEVPPGKRSLPRWLPVITVCFLLIVILSFVFISQVEDILGSGLDMVMLATIFGGPVIMVMWAGWFLFFSGWQMRWRLAACGIMIFVPWAFLKVFRPVNGGDATIMRFEPFWLEREEVAPEDVPVLSDSVDLKIETPNDFAQFLGPERNGVVADHIRIDPDGFKSAKTLWKQPIGKGWSGFAARNGFAVTMEQRQDQECVTCYEISTGTLMWSYQHPTRHQDAMNLGRVGPRATPTIFDGLVYAQGAAGNLVCLNGSDGTVVWQQDLTELTGVTLQKNTDADGRTIVAEAESTLAWGRSGSPLIIDPLLIVPGGGPLNGKKSTLIAFDRLTGDVVWRGGDEMIAYGSPVAAHVAGRDQILITAETKVMGFDPEDGKVLWQKSRPGESNGGANTSQVTVVNENEVMTTKGYPDGGGELIRLEDRGGKIIPKSIWRNERSLKTKLMSPVTRAGHAYSFSNGFLECARLSDGQRIWKRRGRFGHGQLLLVGELLLVHSEYGVAYLVNASPDEYTEYGSFPTVDGVCWNTLCLYGNRLLVRSELEAACFEIRLKK